MASVKPILFTSKILSNGEHPIMLRITKDRKSKYIGIGHSCSVKLWDKVNNRPSKKHPLFMELDLLIDEKLKVAKKLIMQYQLNEEDFTLDELEMQLRKNSLKMTIKQFANYYIDRLKALEKLGTAAAYKDALNALMRFTGDKDLAFRQIDYIFLVKFEEHLLKREVEESSISVYMRTLRALYNKAIAEKYAKQADYPFDSYKISKLNTSTQPRAISKEQVLKIFALEIPPYSRLWHSKNYFMFSYFCRGITISDIAKLKWSNIVGGRIHYKRSKTAQDFSIGISQSLRDILNIYEEFREDAGYVFPILSSFHNTAARIRNRTKKVTKDMNRDLKKLASLANIDANLTSYVARHSYATVLYKQDLSLSKIREAMGHSSEKVTQVYLESFGNAVLDEADNFLL